MAISDNLRSLRRAAKITQAVLAARSGVTQQLISAIENGRVAGTNALPALASALGVHVSDIDPRYDATSGGAMGGDTIDFIPIVPWESIPHLADNGLPTDVALFPALPMVGLAPASHVALRVTSSDMHRVSPPDSIIIVNLDDTRLISGKYYVIEDADTGATLYRRLMPGGGLPTFVEAPCHDERGHRVAGRPIRAKRVFGRVYRTLCDL